MAAITDAGAPKRVISIDDAESTTVRWARPEQLRSLGIVGGTEYFAIGSSGSEYAVRGYATAETPPMEDEVRVAIPARSKSEAPKVLRLRPVPSGTFERKLAYANRDRTRPLVATERLANRELSAAKAAQYVDLRGDAGADDLDGGALRSILSPSPQYIVSNGRKPIRSIEGAIAFCKRRGVVFGLSRDRQHLLVESTGLAPSTERIIEAWAPLIRAFLAGEPLLCAFDHGKAKAPAAVSIAVGGAPVCEAHLSGEVRK